MSGNKNLNPLPKGPYKSEDVEPHILELWLENKYFKPEYHPQKGLQTMEEMLSDNRDTFCIINPPPNAYMRPHVGNVSGYAYQDVFLRYNRMLGKKVLGQPGKDHAGIQGEVVLEKIFLVNKKKSKQDMGRDKFYMASYSHFLKLMPKVMDDEKRIGLSSDYDRNLFTLDPRVVKTVLGTFSKMFEDKMIYKGVRIVNWDPVAKTTLADIDTEREEREGELVYIKYPLSANSDTNSYIEVATTRAETILGDTAVVVNPKDDRYKDLIGKKLILPIVNREIPVISSPHVDMEFGTGAVKLTPAHSMDDYKMMMEWNDQITNNNSQTNSKSQVLNSKIGYINIIDKDGKMTGPIPEKYKGLTTEECRKEVIKDLDEAGLVTKREPHSMNVMVGERSKAVVEQIMSSQWFIDVEKLKQPAIKAVKDGDVKVHPAYMKKKYLHWMENLRDWPVSRSLWWGYRIPVWYKGEVKEEINQETGQIVETIHGTEIEGIYDAVEKGLARVQQHNPGVEENFSPILVPGRGAPENRTLYKDFQKKYPFAQIVETGEISQTYHDYKMALDQVYFDEKSVIVAHSLGAPAIIQYILEKELKIKHLILLAPTNSTSPNYESDLEAGFWADYENVPKIKGHTQELTVIYSDNDEFYSKEALEEFADYIGAEKVFEPGEMHFLRKKYRHDSEELEKLLDIESKRQPNGTSQWIQDPDVLDTWFSSGQWPYATLTANNLMDTFYPSDIMETAYDILELWVSRMIMLGLYTQGEVPFKDVYLHGLVKAPDGQKMSKSKGNVINPEDIIKEYGADALRLMYIVGNKAGAGYPISYEKLEGYKRFLNKIWNASKFVIMNTSDLEDIEIQPENLKEKQDEQILKSVEELTKDVTKHIDKFRIGLAADLIYQHFWHTFCDEHLEEVKSRLYTKDKDGNPINQSEEDQKSRREAQQTLLYALKTYLKLMHPFIPFITERIWQALLKTKTEGETIMYEKWTK